MKERKHDVGRKSYQYASVLIEDDHPIQETLRAKQQGVEKVGVLVIEIP